MAARAKRGSAAMTVALHGALLLLLLSYRPSAPPPALSPAPPTDLLFLPPAEPPPKAEPVELKTIAEAPKPAPAAPPASDPAPRLAGAAAPLAPVLAPPALTPTITPLPLNTPPAGGATGGIGSGTGTEGSGFGGGGGTGTGGGGGGAGARRAEPRPALPPPGDGAAAIWIVKPTAVQLANARPFLARRRGIAGRVKLSCLVDERNRARRCRVVSERPLDYGFGQAARRLSEIFLIKPPVVGGRPSYTTRVTVDIVWDQVGP